ENTEQPQDSYSDHSASQKAIRASGRGLSSKTGNGVACHGHRERYDSQEPQRPEQTKLDRMPMPVKKARHEHPLSPRHIVGPNGTISDELQKHRQDQGSIHCYCQEHARFQQATRRGKEAGTDKEYQIEPDREMARRSGRCECRRPHWSSGQKQRQRQKAEAVCNIVEEHGRHKADTGTKIAQIDTGDGARSHNNSNRYCGWAMPEKNLGQMSDRKEHEYDRQKTKRPEKRRRIGFCQVVHPAQQLHWKRKTKIGRTCWPIVRSEAWIVAEPKIPERTADRVPGPLQIDVSEKEHPVHRSQGEHEDPRRGPEREFPDSRMGTEHYRTILESSWGAMAAGDINGLPCSATIAALRALIRERPFRHMLDE